MIIGLFVAPVCFAGEPVINHIADAFSGHNDYIETWMYGAVTIDLEKVPLVNILNADLRIKMSTPIGNYCFEKGILETGLEWKF